MAMHYGQREGGRSLILAAICGSAVLMLVPYPGWASELEDLPEWALQDNTLVTVCQFQDFVDTINFVNQLVAPAEALAHHPDLTISYNQLTIRLTTHDAGGLTNLDFALAREISDLSAGRCQPL
jgi:4a-hydroxytetrahydrobiopterin dehydratase